MRLDQEQFIDYENYGVSWKTAGTYVKDIPWKRSRVQKN